MLDPRPSRLALGMRILGRVDPMQHHLLRREWEHLAVFVYLHGLLLFVQH